MAGTGKAHLRPQEQPLLSVQDLNVEFNVAGGRVHAVSGISFDVLPGETLGLVGESGCGKSSTGRAVIQLPPPQSGSVRLGDVELTGLRGGLRAIRPRFQMIYQDPVSSLNPRRKVRDIVGEGPRIWGREADRSPDRVDEMLHAVGLEPALFAERRVSEMSGGQCQRVCIARALMLRPEMLICDEPVSALDVSVQAQIVNLLKEARARHALSLVFIAHDLAVVKNISDRILVMYLGKVCEVAGSDDIVARPAHPYTQTLLEATPRAGVGRAVVGAAPEGEMPSPLAPPSGCRFRTRCPLADQRCREEEPQLRFMGPGHFVACHHAEKASAMA